MSAIRTILVTALLLAFALPAAGQPYLALGASQIKVESTVTSTETSPYLVAGWRFNEHLAAEGSYFKVASAQGTGLAALGTLPIGRGLSLLGKIGAYAVKTRRGVSPTPAVKTDHGTRPAVGVGAAYEFHEHLAVRAMFEQVDGKDELENVRLFSVVMVISF
jgi:hypothetical protein